MSDLKTFTFTLGSITKEMVPYKDESKGTYQAVVINLEGTNKSGEPYQPIIVPAALLTKKDGTPAALKEQLKYAQENLIGQRVDITKEGFTLRSIKKSERKTFSGKGTFSKGSSGGGYDVDGQKRGHAITNAVNLSIASGDTSPSTILENAKMILEVSAQLEAAQTKKPTNTTAEKPPEAPAKKAVNSEVVELEDFDF